MALIAKKGQGYDLPPEGTFQGVVFAVYDGGKHLDSFIDKKTQKRKETNSHKIKIGIELDELYQSGAYAGSRITRYQEYTLSLGDNSKLLPAIEALLGRALSDEEREGFDVETLIGSNCLVTIMHKEAKSGNIYAESKIGAIPKKTPPMEPILKPDYLPEFIQKWQAEGDFSTESTPTHGQEMANDKKQSESLSLEEDLQTMIFRNEITLGDYKSQILKVHGKPADSILDIPNEEALDVYTDLTNLAEFKKSGQRPPRKLGGQ